MFETQGHRELEAAAATRGMDLQGTLYFAMDSLHVVRTGSTMQSPTSCQPLCSNWHDLTP